MSEWEGDWWTLSPQIYDYYLCSDFFDRVQAIVLLPLSWGEVSEHSLHDDDGKAHAVVANDDDDDDG